MQNTTGNSGPSADKVESMFDSISKHYDRLNHLLSFGTDRFWRRRAVSLIGRHIKPVKMLDVATGTGDLAIEALRLRPEKITGIDISSRMLEEGLRKINDMGYGGTIELLRGDASATGFSDGTFDVVMSAFGVRNFENTLTGLTEMCRVVRPGGMIMVLEFSRPEWFPFRQIYGFYFRRILPLIGRKVSGDRSAYSYLPDSVMAFPDNEKFLVLLEKAGFSRVAQKRLTGGIASIYTGFRNGEGQYNKN
ncbi:MAG: bifunctional demethylmenaquinone methyltransferase/2-methoxy-6-polyprenyl-1,4-benzoquinol methylase UbiE [Bacteroidales bacterium]|jgi:demethylmenaquinone methyltransferase/2-methoxy-6-polyprenyl-1,4-benzoquinol methylase|nr:bifunctional demethylmenaquinone methyltransferase/2-methoxy-6-polyprenyl-1,4-benzoquinol methylase UbiE [Bacteroidales bacterium]HNX85121.1 bifunctional demethylmenaquinone methyltransferase/2-methoxy-6-polyprenyl-1,4-benzoquinol methylase UbiE [Bacteroidales bacterium]HOC49275.1 bifunctional demethylmenaquinone methyltransferase/2-methoxy-6-polyprenyl-1,4-benzoquinol methylase UbiE [Bacteroidales bacterium]HPS98167.1 bifunctional demethylmenaquinone methyltransferase/2-methoxy-6-polyprenyl-